MTITPYSISESTKISDAYLNNVINEASPKKMITGAFKQGAKKLGKWLAQKGDDVAGAAAKSADDVAGAAAKSADDVAGAAAKSADDVAGAAAKSADDVAGAAAKSADDVAGAAAGTAGTVAKKGVVDGITDTGKKILKLVPNSAKKAIVTVPALGYAAKVGMENVGSGIDSISTAINGTPLPPDAPDGHKSWNQLLKEFISKHPYITIGAILIPVIKYIVSKVGVPLIDAIKKNRGGVSGKEFVIADDGKYLHSNGFSDTVSKDIVIFKNRADAESAIDALNAVTKSNYKIEELSKVIG